VKWSCSAAARSAISVNRFFASVIDRVSIAIILAIGWRPEPGGSLRDLH
jgi:hypothetical protein